MKQSVYFNGTFIDESEANVSIKTHALQYGTACFEGIRAYYNDKEEALYVVRMEDHYKRLLLSTKIMYITLPHSVEDLCDLTVELLQKNFLQEDIYIRPFAYKAGEAVGNFNLQKLADGFLIYTTPLGRYLNAEKGIHAGTSSWTRIPDNAIPARAKIAGSYVNTSFAKTEAELNGYDEALFMDRDGHIMEGSAENIFIVKNGTVITPPITDDILQGITRDTVMQFCQKELHMPVLERSIDRTETYQADEVFLVGTGAEISPVVSIDHRSIGDGTIGPVSIQIKDLYNKLVHGELTNYQHWITKVTK